MKHTVEELIFLVELKNEINRRRMRFYKCCNGKGLSPIGPSIRHMHIDPHDAYIGYCKASADMRAMTPTIKRVAKALGAKMIWSAGWKVIRVYFPSGLSELGDKCVDEGWQRIEGNLFKKIANDFAFEKALLKG